MPLQKLEIRDILLNQGLITFTSDVPSSTALVSGGCGGDLTVDNNFAKLKVTANRAENRITLKRVSNDSTDYDGVNIRTVDAQATFGTINTPGIV